VREDLCSANVGYETGKGSIDILCEGNGSKASESLDKAFKMLLYDSSLFV